jgi:N utilization substance protein A
MGKTEGILAAAEQVRNEGYHVNSRMKFFIMDVRKTMKGPQIYLSRSHPGLVKRLFELEVPEIQDGVVEIRGLAREAGSRTKMAVFTEDEGIDPVGACVGSRGIRVQSVVDELSGEKIDIINWSDDAQRNISNALSPAKVECVIMSEDGKSATVVVPDYQLSLAIGKEGQNVRLAAKLCGRKIDIKSHSQYFPDQTAYEDVEYVDDLQEMDVFNVTGAVVAQENDAEDIVRDAELADADASDTEGAVPPDADAVDTEEFVSDADAADSADDKMTS